MTDKEQKKWHEEKWGTNEEPEETPTERPHCDNDSLKNQDKEQIIIDGVDVSGCCYAILPKNQCPAKIMPYAKETSCIACKEHNTKLNFCKNNPNCYFKQLSRKTAECEKYEQALDTVSEYIKDNCNSCQGIKYGGCEKCELKRIKDIINKAKGEEDER